MISARFSSGLVSTEMSDAIVIIETPTSNDPKQNVNRYVARSRAKQLKNWV